MVHRKDGFKTIDSHRSFRVYDARVVDEGVTFGDSTALTRELNGEFQGLRGEISQGDVDSDVAGRRTNGALRRWPHVHGCDTPRPHVRHELRSPCAMACPIPALAPVTIHVFPCIATTLRQELARVQDETLEEIGHRMASEERRRTCPHLVPVVVGQNRIVSV